MKICLYCNLEKSEFYSSNICIECVSNQNGSRDCKKCGINKPLSQYYRKQNSKDGHKLSCKACELDHMKKLYNLKTNKVKTNILTNINLYKEFIEDKIITSDLYKDKITATLLYKEYKQYVVEKGSIYNMSQIYFLDKIIESKLLGDYEYAGFHYCKIKDSNV